MAMTNGPARFLSFDKIKMALLKSHDKNLPKCNRIFALTIALLFKYRQYIAMTVCSLPLQGLVKKCKCITFSAIYW